MADLSAFNAFLLLKVDGYHKPRKSFIFQLSQQLAETEAKSCIQRNIYLLKSTKEACRLLDFLKSQKKMRIIEAQLQGAMQSVIQVCHSYCDICTSIVCPNMISKIWHWGGLFKQQNGNKHFFISFRQRLINL